MTAITTQEPSGSPLLLPGTALTQFGEVPVLEHLWPDSEELNARLQQVILARMASSHGLTDTNVGGWHSERDLARWEDPAVSTLLDRVRAMARAVVAATVGDPLPDHLENWNVEGWANVNARGAFNTSHHHAGGRGNRNVWSGIYYVAEGSRAGGLTKFEDRSGVPKDILRSGDLFDRELTVVPRAGLMVFFPATLWHRVTPYEGDGVRITVAFNLKHDGFAIPRYPEPEPPSFLWRNLRGPMLLPSRLKRFLFAPPLA